MTALFGGLRVAKQDLRVEAYGTLDELNAYIGLLSDQEENKKQATRLKRLIEIQHVLFVMGAYLAADPTKKSLSLPVWPKGAIQDLEDDIDVMQASLPAMRYFILPGGNAAVSVAHIARCVCRRAERRVAQVMAEGSVFDAPVMPYINRLSDYLFALARVMGMDLKVAERSWKPQKEITKPKTPPSAPAASPTK